MNGTFSRVSHQPIYWFNNLKHKFDEYIKIQKAKFVIIHFFKLMKMLIYEIYDL